MAMNPVAAKQSVMAVREQSEYAGQKQQEYLYYYEVILEYLDNTAGLQMRLNHKAGL